MAGRVRVVLWDLCVSGRGGAVVRAVGAAVVGAATGRALWRQPGGEGARAGWQPSRFCEPCKRLGVVCRRRSRVRLAPQLSADIGLCPLVAMWGLPTDGHATAVSDRQRYFLECGVPGTSGTRQPGLDRTGSRGAVWGMCAGPRTCWLNRVRRRTPAELSRLPPRSGAQAQRGECLGAPSRSLVRQ